MKLSPKEILKPALALLIICVAATALLALTNSVTAARIAETERENAIAARRTVMPDAADSAKSRPMTRLHIATRLTWTETPSDASSPLPPRATVVRSAS